MGKASTPDIPDYKGLAIASSNLSRYNESGPFGSVNWSLRPGADPNNPQPGDYIRSTQLSPEQMQLYRQNTGNQLAAGRVAQGQLSQLGGDESSRQALQDALYRRATSYYDQNFGDQEAALRTRLINSGLSEGTEAYDREMRNFSQNRNTAYADATDRAVIGAENQYQTNQNNAVSRLAQILAMSRGQGPVSGNGQVQSPDLASAALQGYNAQLASSNAQNAQFMQGLGSLGQIAAMYFSDRRLKSNITKVGEGFSGLPVYEYEIFGKRERGYMADEVAAVAPEAVLDTPSGYQMVNYALLGGRP